MGEMNIGLVIEYQYYYFNDFNGSCFRGRFLMELGIETRNECIDFSPLQTIPPYESRFITWWY